MGMAPQLGVLWNEVNVKYLDAHQRASDVGGALGAISKVMRMVLQSAMLGIGALLVIQQQATAGVMIAASILVARALAPVDLAIANWRSFVAFRQSWRRLNELLKVMPDGKAHLELPKPVSSLSVEGVRVVPPGGTRMVVQDVTFRLTKGSALGIVGPSASGKSSLARGLVGVWQAVGGAVRLDEAKLDQWPARRLGPPCRLSAARRGAVLRHRRAKHRPAGKCASLASGHRGGHGRRRARDDPASARGL